MARSARSPRRRAGSPRPPGSATGEPSCRQGAGRGRDHDAAGGDLATLLVVHATPTLAAGRCRLERTPPDDGPRWRRHRLRRIWRMPARYRFLNAELRDALAKVAPGTPLRAGIERIVRSKGGALVVHQRRPRGAGHLLRRIPRRCAVQPATAVRAGQDGRRDHPVRELRADRPGQRAPRPRSHGAHERDRDPPPHRRAGRPVAERAGDLGERGDGRHQPLRRWLEAPAAGRQPPARPGQPGAADARALQGAARGRVAQSHLGRARGRRIVARRRRGRRSAARW